MSGAAADLSETEAPEHTDCYNQSDSEFSGSAAEHS